MFRALMRAVGPRSGTAVSTVALTVAAVIGGGLVADPAGAAAVSAPLVQQVSSDTLPQFSVNGSSFQHQTELETDTFAWGSTVVAAFQVGRNGSGYGAQAIGYSTSSDNGQTWSSGILPGLSASSPSPNAAYPVVVNQSVAYDAKLGLWVIPSVAYVPSGAGKFHEKALLVNTSPDGVAWSQPVTAVATNVDKAWGVCDNTVGSRFYGTCYVAYSQIDSGDALAVTSSSDGGQTWSAPVTVPSATAGVPATGYNTNPVVQPDGTVVLVSTDTHNGANGYPLLSTVSHDGGISWSVPGTVATLQYHTPLTTSVLRAKDKPTVDVAADGTVYAAWSDCRFHTGCAADDIVYATSTDGVTWNPPIRVAVDPVDTGEDKVIPGFGVEPGTSGPSAHLGVVFYTFSAGSCAQACLLQADYTESFDGGSTWSVPFAAATPAGSAFPLTDFGRSYGGGPAMVGDYLSVSFVHGSPVTVVSLPSAHADPGPHQAEFALTLPSGWGEGTSQATALSAQGPLTITRGSSTTITTTLTDTSNGGTLAGAPVTLLGHDASTNTFTSVASAVTDRFGAASVAVAPSSSWVYQWSFDGNAVYARADSPQQSVLVRQLTRIAAGRPVTIPYGASTAVRATLTDATSRQALAGVTLTLQAAPARGGSFSTVATAASASAGVVAMTVRPRANTRYRWTWLGNGAYAGSTSGAQTVSVAQTVSARLSSSRLRRNHAVAVYGTVAPTTTGLPVVLQRYWGGAWHGTGVSARIRYQRMPDGRARTGFVLVFTSHVAGAQHLRVARAATNVNAAGVSASLSVRYL